MINIKYAYLALGPLNPNWFDDLNDECAQEMFNEKGSCNLAR